MKSNRINRSKLVRLQVVIFLLIIFGVGFLFGWTAGSKKATKRMDKEVKEAVVIAERLPATTPTESAIEPPEESSIEPPVVFYDVPLSEDLQEYIMALCEQEEVPVPLILAMIEQESQFQADVVSQTNDYGLCQINTINHEWLSEAYGVTDFLDPYQNVLCGISIIGGYLREYGDVTKALMCYNRGEHGANRLWERGVESIEYSQNILAKMEKYMEVTNDNDNHS